MKKRLLSAVLILCLLLLGSSCGNFEVTSSTYEKLVQAGEKFEAMDDLEIDIEIGMDIDISGTTFSLPMEIEVKRTDAQSETPTTYAKSTFTMLGQTVVTEAYEYDGWTYNVAGTGNYKTPTVDSANAYADMGSIFTQIPKDTANKYKFKENSDGTETVVIPIPDAQAVRVLAPVIDNTSDVTDASSSAVTVTDSKATVTLKDGYYSSYEVTFTMTATVSGMETVYKMTVTADYNDPDATVTIRLPEGYEEFPRQ